MFRSVLFVLMGLLVCGPVAAAEMEESATLMGEVVVTAGRVEETVQEQTMNVTVISSEEIKASPARDLGELLAENGIGYIQKTPGALTTASIRGFKTNAQNDLLGYSLILINGRRAATGNMAMLMTSDIERVEIIRGPGAVQYGSAAMGGVINVITRQGVGHFNAEVSGALGSFGFAEGGVLLSGDTERFDYSLGFTRSTMDDYRTGANHKYFNTGFDAKESYSLNVGFNFLDVHRLGLMLNGTQIDKTGTPNYLSQNDLDDYRNSDFQAIDISYEGETIDGSLAWKLNLFETETDDLSYISWLAGPDFGEGPLWDAGEMYSRSSTGQRGAQGQISGEINGHSLVVGMDWYDYDIESPLSPNRSTFENIAGFAMVKSKFLDEHLIIDAGLRYDAFEVNLIEPTGTTEKHKNVISNFGVAYLLNDNLKVRAHYGEAFKVPGADQLAANYTVTSYGPSPDFLEIEEQYIGNPDLDPESSKTYEVGVDYIDERFKVGLGYFYTRFKDKITKVVIPGGYTWENVGKSLLSGIEAETSAEFALLESGGVRIQPYLNVTYFDRFRDEDDNTDLMYMNDMNAAYGFRLKMPKDLSAQLNFVYHGRKWINNWEDWSGDVIEMGGFTVADLRISKQLFDSNCSVSAQIGNLFDKDYAFVKGYPMPGRNFQVNLKYRF